MLDREKIRQDIEWCCLGLAYDNKTSKVNYCLVEDDLYVMAAWVGNQGEDIHLFCDGEYQVELSVRRWTNVMMSDDFDYVEEGILVEESDIDDKFRGLTDYVMEILNKQIE